MARRNDLKPMHCIVCTKPIPPERKADAVTCSKECTKARKDFGRSLQDAKECRYCQRPSTPEERQRYMTWRRWEKKGLTDEQSAASLLKENARLRSKLTELTGSMAP